MKTLVTCFTGLSLLTAIACVEEVAESPTAAPEVSEGSDGSDEPGTDPMEMTDPMEEPPVDDRVGRVPTRMTIEQLIRSIPVITGGIEWTEDFGEGENNMLQSLAPSMGAPDYLLVTEENREPSLIVAKFMQDAAGRICTRWVARDALAGPSERTLVTHEDWQTLDPALVKANLRRLQLRFFARYVPPAEEASIADLYELFEVASGAAPAGAEAEDGWLAVCLALMTDPALLIY